MEFFVALLALLTVVGLPITLILSIYWFFKRWPPKEKPSNGRTSNLFDWLKRYRDDYPGLIGNGVMYTLIFSWIAVLALRILSLSQQWHGG